jgi:RNA polymerase sigma-70 factor (ECF subfamily)
MTAIARPLQSALRDTVTRLDEASFTTFYRQTSRALWSYVYRVSGSGADADDIVQETFCRLLCRPDDLPDDEQRRRFLYVVASRLLVDRWRKSRRQAAVWNQPVPIVDPAESNQDVARMFAQLTKRERALLWLAYVEGNSHAEIAVTLGLRRQSVKVLLFRAKRRLRDLLEGISHVVVRADR